MIMRGKMETITLHTFGPLNAAYTSCVALFPTVLALWDTWIHISSANHSDEASYVEASVDDVFGV